MIPLLGPRAVGINLVAGSCPGLVSGEFEGIQAILGVPLISGVSQCERPIMGKLFHSHQRPNLSHMFQVNYPPCFAKFCRAVDNDLLGGSPCQKPDNNILQTALRQWAQRRGTGTVFIPFPKSFDLSKKKAKVRQHLIFGGLDCWLGENPSFLQRVNMQHEAYICRSICTVSLVSRTCNHLAHTSMACNRLALAACARSLVVRHDFGYIGGLGWAICCAFICQTNPNLGGTCHGTRG